MSVRSLTAAALAAIQQTPVRPVIFFEGEYDGGALRLHTGVGSISWNGHTWTGAGQLLEISPVRESRSLEAIGFSVKLTGLQSSILSTTLQSMRKNKPGRLWLGFFEPAYIDFDFAGRQSIVAKVGASVATITFTRAGATATRVNSAGLIEAVAADTPRIDFDPMTLGCKGLLVEETRTNSFVRCAEFNNASWTKSAASVSADATMSPDGTTTADKIVEDSANAVHAVTQNGIAINTQYAVSVFAKAGEETVLVMANDNTGTASFNLASGTVLGTSAGTATIEPFPNGWYRCKWVFTASGTAAAGLRFNLRQNSAYLGNGVNGFYLWGAQLEAAGFVTSHIPTTSASVTRNADAPILPAGSWVNESEMTIAYEFVKASLPVSGGITAMVVARTNNARAGYIVSGSSTLSGFDGTTQLGPAGGASPNVVCRGAYALNSGGQALCRDGGTVATAAFDGTWDSGQAFGLGCNNSGSNQLNGHLRRVRFFPRRLEDADLVALSGSPVEVPWGTYRLIADPYPLRRGRFDTAKVTATLRPV